MFLKTAQNPQELREARNFIKKDTLPQVFSCEFCEIFKNRFFYRTPPMAASVHLLFLSNIKIYNSGVFRILSIIQKIFPKIVNIWKPSVKSATISSKVAKVSIIDVWQDPKYTSGQISGKFLISNLQIKNNDFRSLQ